MQGGVVEQVTVEELHDAITRVSDLHSDRIAIATEDMNAVLTRHMRAWKDDPAVNMEDLVWILCVLNSSVSSRILSLPAAIKPLAYVASQAVGDDATRRLVREYHAQLVAHGMMEEEEEANELQAAFEKALARRGRLG